MWDLTVITDEGSKGRSFRASLIAYAVANSLWPGGDAKAIRPVWAMIAASDAESLPFIRNMQSGRKATMYGGRDKQVFECLKSAGYEYAAQRHPEGHVWTVYLPDLYRIDPGMVDPNGVTFAIMPATDWLMPEDQATAVWLADMVDEYRGCRTDGLTDYERRARGESYAQRLAVCAYVTRIAPLFCAYLDRRTRCPLIPDPRFYALVLTAMLKDGHASLASKETYGRNREWGCNIGYQEHGLDAVGCSRGVVCRTDHKSLEPLLADCVRVYEAGGFMDIS